MSVRRVPVGAKYGPVDYGSIAQRSLSGLALRAYVGPMYGLPKTAFRAPDITRWSPALYFGLHIKLK